MHRILLCILLLMLSTLSYTQHFLRGKIRDEKGMPITDVSIKLFSTKQVPYKNGNDGSFGFNVSNTVDTMYLLAEGYEPLSTAVYTNQFNLIELKPFANVSNTKKSGLSSKTKDLEIDENVFYDKQGESYSGLVENTFVSTNKNPQTRFGLTVDRAAYSNIRRFINNELFVPTDAVRIEEMLNYFDFKDSLANPKKFTLNTQLTTCPWNKNEQLLFITTNFPKINYDTVAPSNLVFLIDISGSMERPNRLPLLQAAFNMLVDNLRAKDKVAIVTYGGGVTVELESTSAANKAAIKNVINKLVAEGDTPGANAIIQAYNQAKKSFIKGGNNRVILATDGDFNVGQTTDKELEELITVQRQSGVYLSCIGVGMGNYKDSKLETLAKKGNGNFAYLDNIQEAEKVFMQEFAKTIYVVAKDASLQVDFNKNIVSQYRLIGYDNKTDALKDANSAVSGGEIGSGHNSMAVFEVMLNNKVASNETIANIALQAVVPTADTAINISQIVKYSKPINIDSTSVNLRLAAAVCMYAGILRYSKYIKGFDFNDIADLVTPVLKTNNYLHQEFLTLLDKSENIYHINKKKKKKSKKKK